MNAYGWLTIRRKTFAVGRRTAKTAKVFPLESFVIYSTFIEMSVYTYIIVVGFHSICFCVFAFSGVLW